MMSKFILVEDPEGGAVDWFQIDEAKTVGLNGKLHSLNMTGHLPNWEVME